MSEFSVYLDRDDFRWGMPSPHSTHIHDVGPTPQGYVNVTRPHGITLIDYQSVTLAGTPERVRAALDQLELAYDQWVNPPVLSVPEQGRPRVWTGD